MMGNIEMKHSQAQLNSLIFSSAFRMNFRILKIFSDSHGISINKNLVNQAMLIYTAKKSMQQFHII